jgi:uncharacterized membrane protein
LDVTICEVCNGTISLDKSIPINSLNKSLIEVIRKEHPNILEEGSICLECLNHYRTCHLADVLKVEKGNLTDMEKNIAKSVQKREILSKNINDEFEENLSFGDRLADKVADIGGSWGFIGLFALVILAWLFINTAHYFYHFDPAPYGKLNLILSCLAAFQSPIIMMSQNRKASKDRMLAEHQYKLNLKMELEMRRMHEKLDFVMNKLNKVA